MTETIEVDIFEALREINICFQEISNLEEQIKVIRRNLKELMARYSFWLDMLKLALDLEKKGR